MSATTAAPDLTPRRPSPFAAELIKLFSLGVHRRIILASVIGGALTAVLLCATAPVTTGRPLSEFSRTEVLTTSLFGVDFAALVMIILAAFLAGGEFSSQLAEPTFLLTPRRSKVLVAKMAVMGIVGAVVGLSVVGICLGLGTAFAATADAVPDPAAPALLRIASGTVLMPIFYAVMSVAATLVFRSAALGIVVLFAILGVPTIVGWLPAPVGDVLLPLMPASAIHSLAGVAETGSPEQVPVALAMLVLVGWVAIWGGLAAWRLKRKDV